MQQVNTMAAWSRSGLLSFARLMCFGARTNARHMESVCKKMTRNWTFCAPIPGFCWSFVFFLNSALLGVGLAMDAFSVSLANGLHDPYMSRRRGAIIAGTFGVFQAVMPMAGWLCVHTIVELFSAFETFVPWIALALLGYIGGKMLLEGIKGEEAEEAAELSAGALFMQGVATSIDALSVGFTISEYGWLMALVCSLIVATVTFFLCEAGLSLGKKFGTKLSGKASILGGVILIGIGVEIFISGVFG